MTNNDRIHVELTIDQADTLMRSTFESAEHGRSDREYVAYSLEPDAYTDEDRTALDERHTNELTVETAIIRQILGQYNERGRRAAQ